MVPECHSNNNYQAISNFILIIFYFPGTSNVFADQLYEVFEKRLRVPAATRWNSLYDAVVQLNEFLDKEGGQGGCRLEKVVAKYNAGDSSNKLPFFTTTDKKIFKEYAMVCWYLNYWYC